MYLALARHSLVFSFGLPKAQAARMMMGITANHSINHLAAKPVYASGICGSSLLTHPRT